MTRTESAASRQRLQGAFSRHVEQSARHPDAPKDNAETLTDCIGVLKRDVDALSRDLGAQRGNPDAEKTNAGVQKVNADAKKINADAEKFNVFAKPENPNDLIFSSLHRNAVQPRMDTDGHGYQAVARKRRLTQAMSEKRSPKSVFIRVHPWLMIFHPLPTAECS